MEVSQEHYPFLRPARSVQSGSPSIARCWIPLQQWADFRRRPETLVHLLWYPFGTSNRARLVSRVPPSLPFLLAHPILRQPCHLSPSSSAGSTELGIRSVVGPHPQSCVYPGTAPIRKRTAGPYDDALGELVCRRRGEGGRGAGGRVGHEGLEGVQGVFRRVSGSDFGLVLSLPVV